MIIRNFLEAKLSDDCIHEGKGLCHHANILPADVFDAPIRFLNYTILPKGATFGAHKHGNDNELYIILEGSGHYTCNGETVPCKAGDVLLAMGNSDVPVGQYTQKILAFYGLDEEKLAKDGVITYGTNVKEVTTQVTEASVDCGVVYCTDAFSAGLTPVDYATKEMCGQVIYPAAVLNISKNQEAAKEFLAYLQTDEAMKVFEAVGFASVA